MRNRNYLVGVISMGLKIEVHQMNQFIKVVLTRNMHCMYTDSIDR